MADGVKGGLLTGRTGDPVQSMLVAENRSRTVDVFDG